MSNTYLIEVSGELGLRDAHAVRELLAQAMASHPAVEVHTGRLTAVDISIIQLLIAAQKSAAAQGTAFTIRAAANGPLRETMLRAGLLLPSGETAFDIKWLRKDGAQ